MRRAVGMAVVVVTFLRVVAPPRTPPADVRAAPRLVEFEFKVDPSTAARPRAGAAGKGAAPPAAAAAAVVVVVLGGGGVMRVEMVLLLVSGGGDGGLVHLLLLREHVQVIHAGAGLVLLADRLLLQRGFGELLLEDAALEGFLVGLLGEQAQVFLVLERRADFGGLEGRRGGAAVPVVWRRRVVAGGV